MSEVIIKNEIINITAMQAWEMLQNESDGIQIPVDVRTFGEYFSERIATLIHMISPDGIHCN